VISMSAETVMCTVRSARSRSGMVSVCSRIRTGVALYTSSAHGYGTPRAHGAGNVLGFAKGPTISLRDSRMIWYTRRPCRIVVEV
jgi:hypothetical protein